MIVGDCPPCSPGRSPARRHPADPGKVADFGRCNSLKERDAENILFKEQVYGCGMLEALVDTMRAALEGDKQSLLLIAAVYMLLVCGYSVLYQVRMSRWNIRSERGVFTTLNGACCACRRRRGALFSSPIFHRRGHRDCGFQEALPCGTESAEITGRTESCAGPLSASCYSLCAPLCPLW